jgi:hypothetical protein
MLVAIGELADQHATEIGEHQRPRRHAKTRNATIGASSTTGRRVPAGRDVLGD